MTGQIKVGRQIKGGKSVIGSLMLDARIVSTDEDSVTIMARAGDEVGGDENQIPIRLSQVEFVRRWCLHVSPSGYTCTRRFGGWSNMRRKEYIESVKQQLPESDLASPDPEPIPEPARGIDQASDIEEAAESSSKCCPNCGASLIPHRHQKKPSWSQVMSSPARPSWYQRL